MFYAVHQPIIARANRRRSHQKPDFGQRAHIATTRVSSWAVPTNNVSRVVLGLAFHVFQFL